MEDSLTVLIGIQRQRTNGKMRAKMESLDIYFLLEFGACSPGESLSPVISRLSRVILGAPRNDLNKWVTGVNNPADEGI